MSARSVVANSTLALTSGYSPADADADAARPRGESLDMAMPTARVAWLGRSDMDGTVFNSRTRGQTKRKKIAGAVSIVSLSH